jgi:hypothetical protein
VLDKLLPAHLMPTIPDMTMTTLVPAKVAEPCGSTHWLLIFEMFEDSMPQTNPTCGWCDESLTLGCSLWLGTNVVCNLLPKDNAELACSSKEIPQWPYFLNQLLMLWVATMTMLVNISVMVK